MLEYYSIYTIKVSSPQVHCVFIAFDEVERILIRSFASPTSLRCHSISDFGRHLGVATSASTSCYRLLVAC